MIPMFDGMPVPGVAGATIGILPLLVCLAMGAVAGLAWLGGRWAEAIRRQAVRDREALGLTTPRRVDERVAA